jgi:hypothetical protein
MYNPIVESDKKKAVIQEIAKGAGFQKYTTNFLKLLVEKDRVNLLNEICESFEEQYCQLTDTQVCRRAIRARSPWTARCCCCEAAMCPAVGQVAGEQQRKVSTSNGTTYNVCRMAIDQQLQQMWQVSLAVDPGGSSSFVLQQ